ncbi:MAG TPA: FKBP-type peptidyl-prolyl cis-trans isomerase [Haliscomenobacter sp.]|uniref:FKBP-type peptidyl-prolyl cis-trans isomerase n=1 Tax=Haliscomenobacter sp. TaxID=2717303 RepID=UPI002C9C9359|nr:FKBP-type peptidyl-prolyl cis-trans isomerase [Haliscomenobacter sp.]HOY20605.1 FKBP-type peptidyl-prolyl cis-trans isomerase [Haliscomenobacter sp.]HPH18535.1 FKBP-type peptidyl-prolyl cis-trans isomerase [Haliscomenobacter sp.]
MIVEEHNVVTLSYELRSGGPEGEIMEIMNVHYPFKFFCGGEQLLPAFEEQLRGLGEGDSFEFVLPPNLAYGEVDPEQILEVPRALFAEGDEASLENVLVEGNFIVLSDEEGEDFHGKIISWDEDQVKVDFNHAMAGKTLHFKGVVLNIRKATVDELIRKQVVEEDGVRGWDWGVN